MGKKQKITQYRERLDRTLASPKLTNLESVKELVKNQVQQSSGQETEGCSETVIEKRTAEVWNFLDMLRSASTNDSGELKTHETATQPEWKLKQDTEEFRVMYREGPQGTPFHMLLVEGYVDGPLDVCLCISWESALYKKWWPQSTIPTFKILSCNCLQKVRIGEQISLVRMKVSWPLSTREAVVHYFLFEYLEDDLLVVLLNTISDTGSINRSTHGFTNEAIPEANDVVRIDVVGGFALQKVTQDRSYFRTIANMDVKLDFVPPSLINFIARQLIGNGFKLYQKAVSSTFKTDEDFSKALRDSLYTRIHNALYSAKQSIGILAEKERKSDSSNLHIEHETSNNLDDLEKEHKRDPEEKKLKSDSTNLVEEHEVTNNSDELETTVQKVNCNYHAIESLLKDTRVTGRTALCEIEEIQSEESKHFEDKILVEKVAERSPVCGKRNISSEVEQALGTLEKVISMVREYGFNTKIESFIGIRRERTPDEDNAVKDSKSLEDDRVCSDHEARVEVEKEVSGKTSSKKSVKNQSSVDNSRQGGSNSFSKEVNHNRIAPASPEQKLLVPPCDPNTDPIDSSSAKDGPTQIPISDHITRNNKEPNGVHKNNLIGGKNFSKQKSLWLCCFGSISQ